MPVGVCTGCGLETAVLPEGPDHALVCIVCALGSSRSSGEIRRHDCPACKRVTHWQSGRCCECGDAMPHRESSSSSSARKPYEPPRIEVTTDLPD